MKLKLIFAALGLLFAFDSFSQGIEKGSGVLYTNGVPSHTPDTLTEAEIAINFATGYWYEYSRDSAAWLKAGYRVQEKSGACGAPTYTPQDKQSLVVVDTCGQIYIYFNGTWKKPIYEPSDGDKGDITVFGSGTVWNIDANTIGPTELASTAVLPGTYTNVSITVDADGRITSASTLPLGKRGIYDGSFNTGDSVVTAEVRKELRYVSDSTDAVFAVDMTPGLYGTQVTLTPDSLKLYFYDVAGSNELSLGPVGILMKTSSLRPLTIQGDAAKYAANYAPFSAREIPDFAAVEAAIAGKLQEVDSLYVSGDSLYISLTLDSIPAIAVNLDQFLDNTDTSGYNSAFTRSNDTLFITDANGTLFVKLPADQDNQKIDTFSISSNTMRLSLEDDGEPAKTVDLAPYLDNTDTSGYNMTFVRSNDTLFLTDGDGVLFVKLPAATVDTDDQTLSWSAATGNLTISDGNTISLDGRYLTAEVDGSTTNEIQTIDSLYITGDSLFISLSSDGVPAKKVFIGSLGGDGNGIYDGDDIIPNGTNAGLTPNGLFTIDWRSGFAAFSANDANGIVGITDSSLLYGVGATPNSAYISGPAGIAQVTATRIQLGGRVRITNLTGTPTKIAGLDVNGDVMDMILGTGLSLSGDTLNVTVSGSDNQKIDTFDIATNTLRISVENDGEPAKTVNLAPYLDNTDTSGYNLSFTRSNDTLYLTDNDGTLFVKLPVDQIGTDTSGYNLSFTRSNDTLYLTDGDGTLFVKLPADQVGTDDQTLTWNGATGELSISEGNTVDLDGRYLQSEVDGSTTNEIQTVDTFEIVSNALRLSLLNDGVPFESVDLSPYIDNTDTSGYNMSFTRSNDTLRITDANSTLFVTLPPSTSDGNGIYSDTGTIASYSDFLVRVRPDSTFGIANTTKIGAVDYFNNITSGTYYKGFFITPLAGEYLDAVAMTYSTVDSFQENTVFVSSQGTYLISTYGSEGNRQRSNLSLVARDNQQFINFNGAKNGVEFTYSLPNTSPSNAIGDTSIMIWPRNQTPIFTSINRFKVDTSGYNISLYTSGDTLFLQDDNSILFTVLPSQSDSTGGPVILDGEVNGISSATTVDTVRRIWFDRTYSQPDSLGKLQWSASDQTLKLGIGNESLATVVKIGQETLYPKVINKTGSIILKGTPVMVDTVSPIQGDNIRIQPAIGSTTQNVTTIMGLAAHDIANDSTGFVTWFGYITEVNESNISETGITFSVGSILYLSTIESGKLTNVLPSAPNIKDPIAIVVRKPTSNNLTILVRPQLTPDIQDINDISISSATHGQILEYDTAGGYWKNGQVGSLGIENNAIDSTKIINGGISVLDIGQNGAASGQVLKWNGTQWKAAQDSVGSAGTGQNNVGINLGSGRQVYEGKVDTTLRFRTLVQNYGLTLTQAANDITFNADTSLLATVSDVGVVQASLTTHLNADADTSLTNEGRLGVGAGSGTSSTITTNTSGSNAITINAAGALTISESTSTNGGSITLTSTDAQKIDTFSLTSNTLRLSIERDAEPAKTVNLSAYLDNTDTSGYNLNLYTSNDTLFIEDGAGAFSVKLPGGGSDGNIYDNDGNILADTTRYVNLDSTAYLVFMYPSGNPGIEMYGGTDSTSADGYVQINSGSGPGAFSSIEVRDSYIFLTSNPGTLIQLNNDSIRYVTAGSDGAPGQVLHSDGQLTYWADPSGTTYFAGTGISISGDTIYNTGDLSATNEIQRLDTFAIVGNTLRASLLNDGLPFSSVDLSPYVNVATNLTYTGTTSPITLNSSTGTDVTATAGTGISLSANSTNLTITNTAPDQTVSITNGGGITVGGTYPAFTVTAADQSATNEIQTVDTFDISSNTLRLSLSSDGQAAKTVSLAPYLDNTDNQTLSIDSSIVGNNERFAISISNGNTVRFDVPQIVSDTSGYNISANVLNDTLRIIDGNGIVSAKFSGWDTNVSDDLARVNDITDTFSTSQGWIDMTGTLWGDANDINVSSWRSQPIIRNIAGRTGQNWYGFEVSPTLVSGTRGNAATAWYSDLSSYSDTLTNLWGAIIRMNEYSTVAQNNRFGAFVEAREVSNTTDTKTLNGVGSYVYDISAGGRILNGFGVKSDVQRTKNAYGVHVNTLLDRGTAGQHHAFWGKNTSYGSGVSMDYAAGLWLESEVIGGATLSNYYGIYINNPQGTTTRSLFSNSTSARMEHAGSAIFGSTGAPARTLHVAGEVRITDLQTDNPIVIVGADADGDLNRIVLGDNLSWSGDTLNATAGAGVTDLSFSGASSPVILASSTGNDVRFVAGQNITLSAGGDSIVIESTGGGGGVSDGDKGDIDVTSSGATWTVDTSAITTIKIAANAVDSTKVGNGALSVTDLGQYGASSGQVLKWNGTQWAPAQDSVGSGGGGSDGNGIYSGSDTIPPNTIATITDEFNITYSGGVPYSGLYFNQVALGVSLSDATASHIIVIEPDSISFSGIKVDFNVSNVDFSSITSVINGLDSTKIANGAISVRDIGQHGATSGQVLKWNGTQWAPASDATGSAGTGEANVGANLGPGAQVYEGKIDTTLRFRSLLDQYGIVLVETDTTIQIWVDTSIIAAKVWVQNQGYITTEVDGSVTNELQDLSLIGQSLNITGGVGVSLPIVGISAGSGISVSTVSGVATITNSAPDQTVSITGGGINSVTGTYPNFTVTATEVDGSTTNEGSLTVGVGGSNSSTIQSNTSGSTPVTIEGGSNITITESGSTITIASSGAAGNIYTVDGNIKDGGTIIDVSGDDALIFNLDNGAGQTNTFQRLIADYTSDDANTHFFELVTPNDSLYVSSFDSGISLDYEGPSNSGSGLSISSNTQINMSSQKTFLTCDTMDITGVDIILGGICKGLPTETVNTSTYTAKAFVVNLTDCSSGAISVTPPSSPTINMRFAVVDAFADAATNNITINFSGSSQKLYGTVQNYIINVNGGYAEFIYMGSTTGWIATKG